MVANFFMEKIDQQAMNTATLKPTAWYRYVLFCYMEQWTGQTSGVSCNINSIHDNIQFTIEIEENKHLDRH